jgi:hypothetical protein
MLTSASTLQRFNDSTIPGDRVRLARPFRRLAEKLTSRTCRAEALRRRVTHHLSASQDFTFSLAREVLARYFTGQLFLGP